MTSFLLCVLRSTVPIDREMYLLLFAAAQAMRQAGGAHNYDLDGSEFSGRVTTEWKSKAFGTSAGPFFWARLEIGSSSGYAEFIVPERWLEEEFNSDDLHAFQIT